jgi:hypothetical protein
MISRSGSRIRHIFTFAMLFTALCASVACDGDDAYTRHPTPKTGNAVIDDLITAMLNRDVDTITEYWNMLPGRPCVAEDEIGVPKCPAGEPAGTVVRVGAFRCGRDAPRLEDGPIGVPADWDLYTVHVDDTRGLMYRIIFTPGGRGDRKSVTLHVRTAKPGLEGILSTSVIGFSETCNTADEQIADEDIWCRPGNCKLLIPPPGQRDAQQTTVDLRS